MRSSQWDSDSLQEGEQPFIPEKNYFEAKKREYVIPFDVHISKTNCIYDDAHSTVELREK